MPTAPDQRPIKFRITITSPHWDEDPGSTKLSKPMTMEQIIDHEQINFTDGGYLDWDDIDWGIDTVRYLQFTGFKDKHGVEIHEGHIVTVRWYPVWNFATVIYSPPRWGLAKADGVCDEWTAQEWEGFEVVGDVYTTPELPNA